MAGCATINGGYHAADNIALRNLFKKEYIKTDLCTLTTFCKITSPGKPITIYIEGDGAAWLSRHELSDDPTPRNLLVLSLAVVDSSENVAYVARPGQLTVFGKPDCNPAYWSERRFSKEVINAMNSAINNLKNKSQSKEINIIGYSGGAAIAVIIAAQRNDIASLRTIAGNLDSEAVNRYHNVSILQGSMNPIDFAGKISHIPQRHFVGSKDKVVPQFIAQSFVKQEGDKNYDRITIVSNATHAKGWCKHWKDLLFLSTL